MGKSRNEIEIRLRKGRTFDLLLALESYQKGMTLNDRHFWTLRKELHNRIVVFKFTQYAILVNQVELV